MVDYIAYKRRYTEIHKIWTARTLCTEFCRYSFLSNTYTKTVGKDKARSYIDNVEN